VASAGSPDQFPAEGLPEIAFLGRSNVGKSSLINALVGRKLAFTSNTPGRTQTLNFFRVNGLYNFVDLPGYGYAEVSKDRLQEWKQLIERYLLRRRTFVLAILLLDARRGWMERDLELKRWLELQDRRFLVIAAKMDKLKTQSEQRRVLDSIRKEGVEPVLFSAMTGRGVREIWQAIPKILESP